MPHHLPGSPGARAQADRVLVALRLPPDAARGGAATTYPEYQRDAEAASPAGLRAIALRRRRRPVSGSFELQIERDTSDGRSDVVHVQGKVHMIVGDGGNIIVQAGDEGVLVIDTGLESRGDELLAAIRRISDKPIRMVINTHVHADHTGANETLARAGQCARRQCSGQLRPRARRRPVFSRTRRS